MCCSLVSSTSGPITAWYQDASRRAGILICNPDLGVGNFLETDTGFVWVEVAGVRVYSCYFSPSDPFDVSVRPSGDPL